MKKYKIGIVGYGEFTKLMLRYLEPYADIIVSSRSREAGEAGHGASFAPMEQVLAQDIIIPSIPSQFFPEFLQTNKDLINPKALMIDVCSVKIKPIAAMRELLPRSVQIIGTHPLFGPASASKSLKDHRIVLVDVRSTEETYQGLKEFCSSLGLIVLERSSEEHDQQMAYVQGLSHYIGRIMEIMQIPDSALRTNAYEDLLDMKRIQGCDSWELFKSIMEENPYAAEIQAKFKAACHELDDKLKS